MREETLPVKVVVYQQDLRAASAQATSLLAILNEVVDALDAWTPDGYIDGGYLADSGEPHPAERGEGSGVYVQRCVLTFEYIREVEA